jgi:aminopeptidase N
MAQSLHLFSLYYICKKMIRYIYFFIVLFCFNVSGQIDSGCVNKSYYMHANKTKGWRVLGLKSEYDVKQYILKLNINPDTLYLSGSVTIIFEITGTKPLINFDAHLADPLKVDSVIYHNNKISSFHTGGYVVANMPQALPVKTIDSVTIYYQGIPEVAGGFSSFAKGSHGAGNAIWTLSQPYGAADWWPCKNTLDDKADSLDIYIKTPVRFKAVANGLLNDTLAVDSFCIYHWKHRYPIATYLVAVAVSNYSIYTNYIHFSPTDSLAMLNYVYPSSLTNAQLQTAKLVKAVELFSDKFGKYPFSNEKYGHAQFGWGGGMEHQTVSFVGNFSQDLLVHELAHQWFGDDVTCGSWTDLWLNEGFATYLTGLSKEFLDTNKETFIDWKASAIDMVTRQAGGYIYTLDTLSVNRLFDGRLTYTKASMVLHMLRKIVGDIAFFKACNNYLTNHRYSFAYTSSLIKEMEKESGKNLQYFFSQWFYGEGYPIYNIYWQKKSNKNILIDVYQRASVNTIDFFEIPVYIRFYNGQTFEDVRLENNFSGQQFNIQLHIDADSTAFNPEYDMLALGNIEQKGTIKSNNNKHVVFYPVSGGNVLNFEVLNGLTINNLYIYDLNGKHIYSLESKQPLNYGTIQLAHVAPGFYVIMCQLSDGSVEGFKIPVMDN